VEIGNHSARHVNLSRCSDDVLAAEVEGSRLRLEAALRTPIRYFSYPDGRYNRRVTDAVAAGHDLAMSVWWPRARTSSMAVPRRPGGQGLDRLRAALGEHVGLDDWREWAHSMWPRVPREARHRLLRGADQGRG
jgi:peptidoglycan/xylan/chitin deacetylase (PgdA/CDA1 family)